MKALLSHSDKASVYTCQFLFDNKLRVVLSKVAKNLRSGYILKLVSYKMLGRRIVEQFLEAMIESIYNVLSRQLDIRKHRSRDNKEGISICCTFNAITSVPRRSNKTTYTGKSCVFLWYRLFFISGVCDTL